MFPAGIVLGIDGVHPANVYPVFVGSVGFSTAVLKSLVMLCTGVPPFELNVIVYCPAVHKAFKDMSFAGIVVGIEISHPAKTYPSFTGAIGGVISVP